MTIKTNWTIKRMRDLLALAENDDSMTSDVFLQCALFGEVVYG